MEESTRTRLWPREVPLVLTLRSALPLASVTVVRREIDARTQERTVRTRWYDYEPLRPRAHCCF